ALGPAVIGTAEARRVAVIGPAQAVAAMAADIQEGAHHAGGVAHHQYRVLAHIGRKEMAGLGDLALMAQKEPAAGEDPLQLLPVDLRLDKDAAADQAAVAVDETTDVAGHVILLNRLLQLAPSCRRPSVAPSAGKIRGGCFRCSGSRWPRRRASRHSARGRAPSRR